MSAKVENPRSVLGAALVLLVAAPPLRAWAVSALWAWFVVPLGVPQIGMAHALGLVMLLQFTRSVRYSTKEQREAFAAEPFLRVTTDLGLAPAVVGIGWCVHEVMQ